MVTMRQIEDALHNVAPEHDTIKAVVALLAEAWDEGCARATPHGGAYLRSFYAENPYRAAAQEADHEPE